MAAEPLRGAASSSLGAIDLSGAIDFNNYQPENGADYPFGGFGEALVSTAAMIKADIGLECVQIDINGWDHHSNMGPSSGVLANMLADLSGGLEAFYTDLQAELGGVTLVVMTEFGRRVAGNGSAGTDHGHGSVMFVLGGNVNFVLSIHLSAMKHLNRDAVDLAKLVGTVTFSVQGKFSVERNILKRPGQWIKSN